MIPFVPLFVSFLFILTLVNGQGDKNSCLPQVVFAQSRDRIVVGTDVADDVAVRSANLNSISNVPVIDACDCPQFSSVGCIKYVCACSVARTGFACGFSLLIFAFAQPICSRCIQSIRRFRPTENDT